jgi:hypothetical protein
VKVFNVNEKRITVTKKYENLLFSEVSGSSEFIYNKNKIRDNITFHYNPLDFYKQWEAEYLGSLTPRVKAD